MGINSRDEDELETNDSQEETNQNESQETSTETISESQEETEAKILKVANKYKSNVDNILEIITTATEKDKNGEKLSETEQEMLEKKTGYTKYTKELGKHLEEIISEGGSEDYVSSLEKTKKYIDKQGNELKELFDEKDQKDIDEYKPVGTGASSKNNFDDTLKQSKNMENKNGRDSDFC